MSITAAAIPVFDYLEQYEAIREEIVAAVGEVFASGSLILGPRVRQFEENFARYLGVGGYGVGVANGTDAIAIALRALGIGPGDEVITVANTAVPTVSAIRMTGARPVFCEIDPDTLLLDPADAEARITRATRAIVPVHLYGNAVDMPRLISVASRHGLAVVEDCAQSCGTTWQGRQTGTFGDVGCFSFYPTKNLGAYGDAGLCFTRRAALADAIRQLRTYGCPRPHDCRREGVNSRLDEVQAAVLDVKLRHLDEYLQRRRAVAVMYDEHLAPRIERPRRALEADHSYHLFVVLARRRRQLIARLASEGIGYGVHYPTPIHRLPAYRFLGYDDDALAITARACERVLSLPCYPELSHDAVRRICRAVNAAESRH
jgi:aminotransferase EvaB